MSKKAVKRKGKTSGIKKSIRILWLLFFAGLGFVILIIVAADLGLLGKMPSIEELQNAIIRKILE